MTAQHFQARIECFSSPNWRDLGILNPVKRSSTKPSLENVLYRTTNSKFTCIELKLLWLTTNLPKLNHIYEVKVLLKVVKRFMLISWDWLTRALSSHATRTFEHFPKVIETKQHRDQEPFRISVKVLRPLKKKKARRNLKMCIWRHIPKSSGLHSFATDCKCFYLRCRNRSESLFTKLVDLNGLTTNKPLKKSKLKTALEVPIKTRRTIVTIKLCCKVTHMFNIVDKYW